MEALPGRGGCYQHAEPTAAARSNASSYANALGSVATHARATAHGATPAENVSAVLLRIATHALKTGMDKPTRRAAMLAADKLLAAAGYNLHGLNVSTAAKKALAEKRARQGEQRKRAKKNKRKKV